MTDKDKLRRKIILALDAVVEDEDVALSKLRTVCTVCYCVGAFLVLVCLGEFWGLNWPAWACGAFVAHPVARVVGCRIVCQPGLRRSLSDRRGSLRVSADDRVRLF